MSSTTMMELVVFQVLLSHYSFSFQRFTLGVARDVAGGTGAGDHSISAIQSMMTPAWMGVLGWLSLVLKILIVYLLWVRYGWMFALGYLAFSFVVMGRVVPLFPFEDYFRRLADQSNNAQLAELEQGAGPVIAYRQVRLHLQVQDALVAYKEYLRRMRSDRILGAIVDYYKLDDKKLQRIRELAIMRAEADQILVIPIALEFAAFSLARAEYDDSRLERCTGVLLSKIVQEPRFVNEEQRARFAEIFGADAVLAVPVGWDKVDS
ncbi:MAG: hypothetical protein IT163_13055 [Bryobacterales bacterium]|nr:hypothetical protein [Bryobacterales bacterium]